MVGKSRKLLVGLFILAIFGAGLSFWATRKIPQEELAKIPGGLPNVGLKDIDGKDLRLQGLLDQTSKQYPKKIFVFWATWCEPCVHEMPFIQAAIPKLHAKGTEVLLINYDGGIPDKTEAEVRAWLISQRIELKSYFDFNEALLHDLKVTGLPFTVAVGADNKIRWSQLGELNWRTLDFSVE